MPDLTSGTDFERFRQEFGFDKKKAGLIGAEREAFTTTKHGVIVPRAVDMLETLLGLDPSGRFTYELSACQVEGRTGPCGIDDLEAGLEETDEILEKALNILDLTASYEEFAPDSMPLDVYPDPTGRYQSIVQGFSQEQLLAACRIIGTHFHVGMPDHETALRVYNKVSASCDELCALGDRSFGKRLETYRTVARQSEPKPFKSWQHFYEFAQEQHFVDAPRRCWTLIRISIHGTIEFRMFGATDDRSEISHWGRRCHALCMDAL